VSDIIYGGSDQVYGCVILLYTARVIRHSDDVVYGETGQVPGRRRQQARRSVIISAAIPLKLNVA
jgi:hypothetical protein